jgi:class 3 adenylate cyclase
MGGRRLTAILAADIAGYSVLMGENETDTVAALKGHQSVILPMIVGFGGRVIDTAGDGILAEFASVLNAVKCAIAVQETMLERNASVAPDRRMQFRIGINQGDVLFDDERIFGDGINVAARLEGLCDPGGICISGKVYEEIKNRFQIRYTDAGLQNLKNIAEPVRVYQISVSETHTAPGNAEQPRLQAFSAVFGKYRSRYPLAVALSVIPISVIAAGAYLLSPFSKMPTAPPPRLTLQAVDEKEWGDAATNGTIEAIKLYLDHFPNGVHVPDAQRALKKVEESAWADATDIGTTASFKQYLSRFPDGAHANQAAARIAELDRQVLDEKAWSTALASGSRAAFDEYVKTFPTGIHAAEAFARISEIDASRVAFCKARFPTALTAVPPPNTLSCNQVVLVLDGTCPAGTIKRLVAGCSEKNIPRQTFVCMGCNPSFGIFGINFLFVTQEVADQLKLPQAGGILIKTVAEDGAAKSAGIRVGDVIVTMDGKELKEQEDVWRILGVIARQGTAAMPAGKKFDVVIIRDGKELTLPVTLEP